MERIDLDEPWFTQAQVLDAVPALTPKTLQNWASRGILDLHEPNPGRQAKRLYTGIGVIMLAFMARVTALGIGPSAARDMAETVAKHAADIHRAYPVSEENGRLQWTIAGSHYELYHRGYIIKHKDQHRIIIQMEGLGILRTQFPHVYLTVEIDFLVLSVLNEIYRVAAGQKASRKLKVSAPTAADARELRKLAKFFRDFSQPQEADDES
jgi:hypothetical protein